MKKSFLLLCFLIVNANACFHDRFDDVEAYKSTDQITLPKDIANLSPDQMVSFIKLYIETMDTTRLDSFLSLIDEKIKKDVLSRKIVTTDIDKTVFTTTFANLAITLNKPEILDILMYHGADGNTSSDDGYSPLTRIAFFNQFSLAEILVRYGINVNAYDAHGNTPFAIAMNNNNKAMIKFLIEHGADINRQDINGDTPLHKAIEKSYDDIIPLLIEHGADITIKNEQSASPLLLAACYGKKEIVKILIKNHEPTIEDFYNAIDSNNVNAFAMLLECCKTKPFVDKQSAIDIDFSALVLGNQDITYLCKTYDKKFLEHHINGHDELHFAAIHGHDEIVRHLIEHDHGDINTPDYYGLTPLHYASMYGNYELVDYIIKHTHEINPHSTKDFNDFKKGLTPSDMAKQCGHEDIVSLLSSNNKKSCSSVKNTKIKHPSHLALFIDDTAEKTNGIQPLVCTNCAFSRTLRDIIKQKACPSLIIGQHLLQNALKLNCSLKDWITIDFAINNVEAYLIIPRRLIDVPSSYEKKSLDTLLPTCGFDLTIIPHTYVDETYVKNKAASLKTDSKSAFSQTIPLLLDAILTPQERYVFWGGHGNVLINPSIGYLYNDDASKALLILAQKNTKIIYLSSCFFGGNQCKTVGNFENMIVISGATTEIATSVRRGTEPHNWRGFFNGLEMHKTCNNQRTICEHLSHKCLPFIITEKPNISNFPHIKFPGEPFKLLPVKNQTTLIDRDTPVIVEHKRLLEIAIPEVKKHIEIKRKIPFIVSNLDKVEFEKISIDSDEKTGIDNISNLFEKITKVSLFSNSTLENTFCIKELEFVHQHPFLMQENTKKTLPKTLYHVFIYRGPGSECVVAFSTDRNMTNENIFCITYNSTTKQWDNSKIYLSQENISSCQKQVSS